MDAQVILATMELVKMLIQLAFQEAAKVDMSEEEFAELLKQERERYKQNIPSNIPDV